MNDEIQTFVAVDIPFNPDDKILSWVDQETGDVIVEKYSYNDFFKIIIDISGLNKELLGVCEKQ